METEHTEQNNGVQIEEVSTLALDLVVQEMEVLSIKFENLVQKERENTLKLRTQDNMIKVLEKENASLKEENAQLQEIIHIHLQNFPTLIARADFITGINRKVENSLEATMILEEDSIKVDIKAEMDEFISKNFLLNAENEELKERMKAIQADLDHLNSFISNSFSESISGRYKKHVVELEKKVEKQKAKEDKEKKKRQKEREREKEESSVQRKRSPIATRHKKPLKKLHLEETPQTIDPDDSNEEDFEINSWDNEDQFDEDDSPKKSRAKNKGKGQSKKGGGSGKKEKKIQTKELQAVQKNMMQYHLFN